MEIKGYKICGELKTTNSGFSKWGFAEKNGGKYFFKEFIDPVYPVDSELLEPEILTRKRQICNEYEERSRLLYEEVNDCSDGNLVHIEEFFRSGSHYYLVMEKITAVSSSIVKKADMEDRIRICKSLIHSIGRLHKKGIVHGDIKLDNIIFRKLDSGKLTGKVIDFDNSFWEKEPPAPDEEIQGDPVYMAPETFRMMAEEEGTLTTAIDVFALGLLFHQLLDGEFPGFDRKAYHYPFEALLNGEKLAYSDRIPELWKNMIIDMTKADPEERLTLEQAEAMWKKRPAASKLIRTFETKKTETMSAAEPETGFGSFFTAAGDL